MSLKILITNDDGIEADGLKYLVEHAKKYGNVIVVAPKLEQSAKSHAINIRTSFECKKVDAFKDVLAYSIDSTPADCVRFAKYGLHLDFDIVLSGINKGYNMGEDIWYSGTVAACFEATNAHAKAIAFSVSKKSPEAYKHFDEAMEYILNNDLLEYGDIYNVNMPNNAKGIKITKQAGCMFETTFEETSANYFFAGGNSIHDNDINKIYYDSVCVENGYISITPLTSNRTDINVYDKLIKKE